jgi:recombination protein RecA
VDLDIIDKRGSWYSYGDIRLGQGRENTKEFLRDNEELMEEIEKAVREQAMVKNPSSPWSDQDEDYEDDYEENQEEE